MAGSKRQDNFWKREQPPAALKHGILRRYAPVFAGKAGKATGGSVAFLDGYAGAGRYGDGGTGSPLLLAETARDLRFRQFVTFLVEADPEMFRRLQMTIAEFQSSDVVASERSKFHLLRGELSNHLDFILKGSVGRALFAFLDPFGTALDRNQLVGSLLARPASVPTEVLLHFSVRTVARVGGRLRRMVGDGREPDPAESKLMERLDRFVGGEWWRPRFAEIAENSDPYAPTLAALDVSREYCERIERETGFGSMTVAVQPRPDLSPCYVLTLFTRHPDGAWHFADAVGKAGVMDWNAAWVSEEERRELVRRFPNQTTLIDVTGYDPKRYEDTSHDMWERRLARNIEDLLAGNGPCRLIDHVPSVYAKLMGTAWEKHVRAAVKRLHRDGMIDDDGRGANFHKRPIRLIAKR